LSIKKEKLKSIVNLKFSKGKTVAIVFALAFIMLSSTLVALSSANSVSATSENVNPAAAYGDIMQYDWPQIQGDSANTRFSAGPAPNSADILWRNPIPDMVSDSMMAFDGKIIVRTTSPSPGSILALDPFTGSIIWNQTMASGPFMNQWQIGIAPNYLVVGYFTFVPGGNSPCGVACLDSETGQILWTMDGTTLPAPQGWADGFVYSPEEKMFYCAWPGALPYTTPKDFDQSYIMGWDFSDPSKPPTLAWKTPVDGVLRFGDWGLDYGDGKVLYGRNDGHEIALDAKTGQQVWDANTEGNRDYEGVYYNGNYLHGGVNDYFISLNGTTGARQWTFKANTFWSFWACAPAAAYGMVYELNSDGHLYSLNATTGQCVWKYGGAYEGNPNGVLHDYPGSPTVADGKVYQCIGTVAGHNMVNGEYSHDETVCLDAYTGKLIWSLPVATTRFDLFVAYGNVYLVPVGTGQVWCIGNSTPNSTGPVNWSMFRGNPAQTSGGGVLPAGPAGPTNMELKWKFNTGGAVGSSATIVNGVVYVGSGDKNIYAIDANTGSKIWSFTTGYYVRSSQAVVDGKVYTGADDGNIYCLNAVTGAQLWKTPAGGIQIYHKADRVPVIRSSPIVTGGRVYVGSLDNNTYCLDANTGNVIWKCPMGGQVTATPVVIANDGLYITAATSPPNATLYKLNADTGALIWKLGIPIAGLTDGILPWYFPDIPSPTVAAGMVFQPDDEYYVYGINATTGVFQWRYTTHASMAGDLLVSSIAQQGSALYAEGKVYVPDNVRLTCLDATTGTQIWSTWLSREVFVSPTYAYGKVYVACEEGTMRVLDANTGATLSYFHPAINIWSSPSLYNGCLYWGAEDFNVYCFKEADLGLTTYYGATPSAQSNPEPAASQSAESTTGTTSTPSSQTTQSIASSEANALSSASPSAEPTTSMLSTEVAITVAVVVIIAVVAAATVVLKKRK
jgi:outer membrane protein assembly factor BamB